jgi:hypothetical protein
MFVSLASKFIYPIFWIATNHMNCTSNLILRHTAAECDHPIIRVNEVKKSTPQGTSSLPCGVVARRAWGGLGAWGRLDRHRITCYKPYNIIQLTLYVTQREHALTCPWTYMSGRRYIRGKFHSLSNVFRFHKIETIAWWSDCGHTVA